MVKRTRANAMAARTLGADFPLRPYWSLTVQLQQYKGAIQNFTHLCKGRRVAQNAMLMYEKSYCKFKNQRKQVTYLLKMVKPYTRSRIIHPKATNELTPQTLETHLKTTRTKHAPNSKRKTLPPPRLSRKHEQDTKKGSLGA